MYFNINKTKRNFILYISALFDIGKLVKNMNIDFDFSEKIKYLLDNTKNISLEKQNMYLNSNIINNNFKIIENELNSMYEKTRILEDIIDYMKLYINNEIENYMLDCRNLLKDIEVLSDINLKEEINYTAINVPFIYNTLEYIDRDGTVLKNCDIYNNKIVLSQNKDITVQINSVSIVRNEALFNLETINDNKDNIIYNKPYLIEYELDSIVNNGINELIRLNFNKEEITEYKKYVEETVVYDATYHLLICIMRDVTDEETEREKKENISRQTIEIADKVVDKQMRVVQEIASLLGETAAETKIALTKLKESIDNE